MFVVSRCVVSRHWRWYFHKQPEDIRHHFNSYDYQEDNEVSGTCIMFYLSDRRLFSVIDNVSHKT